MNKPAVFDYLLADKSQLGCYAIDPNITPEALAEFVRSRDGASRFDFEKLSKDLSLRGKFKSLDEIKVEVLDEPYRVPEKLRAYRDALEERLLAEGKFNGPIAVLDGELGKTIRLRRGGYFDFMATKLETVPGNELPEKYPAGVPVVELMKQYGIDNSERARFLGFAFLMFPDNGKEFQLVQRAKGMGIASDCISSSGGTPPFSDDFFNTGFNFGEYWKNQVSQEMTEEFKLDEKEFDIQGGYIIEDKKTVPHFAFQIHTPRKTSELADRIFGVKDAIKEHPILYSMPPKAIGSFLRQFDVWPSVAFISKLVHDENK